MSSAGALTLSGSCDENGRQFGFVGCTQLQDASLASLLLFKSDWMSAALLADASSLAPAQMRPREKQCRFLYTKAPWNGVTATSLDWKAKALGDLGPG